MIFGILLVRIQKAVKVAELVPYLVDEDYVVRDAASSKLKALLKEKEIGMGTRSTTEGAG